ncbi:MAG: pantoate--beta-alanine ligase [Victivallaceae bacterium]|nr:pantoate--beta-alanine ligase [Victivallaceae bacterium]
MKIFRTRAELREFVASEKKAGRSIGLVPTMGFLHAGHFALIDMACTLADTVIVSVFVNPTQFGPNEDLDKYPRSFEADCRNSEAHGAVAVFAPTPETMYDRDFSVWVSEEKLSKVLCGKTRPIHFRGVCTVVAKLFHLAQPDVACFGQKDAQQALIIQKMVRDLDFPVRIVVVPIVREHDGLALSSRNKYLSAGERAAAPVIHRVLTAIAEALRQHGMAASSTLLEAGKLELEKAGGVIDYLEMRDADTLDMADSSARKILLAAAVKFGTTRLIDNEIVVPASQTESSQTNKR